MLHFCYRQSPRLVVIHFYAEWATECQPMNEVLEVLGLEAELKVLSSNSNACKSFSFALKQFA